MDEEFDLSPLLMEVCSPFAMSPTMSPVAMPEVVPRPISKRRGKKRSSRACTTCRARKVRCNIVAHGAPCSNCRHDEIDCVLPLSRRQRYDFLFKYGVTYTDIIAKIRQRTSRSQFKRISNGLRGRRSTSWYGGL